ncbi:MAG TPA: hypothetical protein VMD59_02865, partial [Acidimicrobiales bacterium]|nr:hypothetical protein [Acidimicrobiales bacterium]
MGGLSAPGGAPAGVASRPVMSPESSTVARSHLQLVVSRLRRDKVAIASVAVIVAVALLAIFAPLVSHAVGHGPDTQYLTTGLSPDGIPVGPSWRFLFGTDDLGRDVFVRVAYGARI